MDRRWLAALVVAAFSGACGAQDAERGRKLFVDTRGTTGQPVGNCVACHANQEALRQMIANRGGKAGDARSVRALLQQSIEGSVASGEMVVDRNNRCS